MIFQPISADQGAEHADHGAEPDHGAEQSGGQPGGERELTFGLGILRYDRPKFQLPEAWHDLHGELRGFKVASSLRPGGRKRNLWEIVDLSGLPCKLGLAIQPRMDVPSSLGRKRGIRDVAILGGFHHAHSEKGLTMENKRPIQRRDFLKSATAASVLAGAATLVVRANEPAKPSDGAQNQSSAGGSMVGQEAVDCMANLLRGMENVRSIYVFEAPLSAKPKKRSIENGSYYDFNPKRPIAVSAEEEKIISKALKLRAASHMPFWDAVLLVCQEQENVPQGLLQAAQHHACAASTAKGQTVTRQQVLGGALKQMCQNKGRSNWIGMTSEVVLDDGSTAHIPMLDFRCRISPLNRKLVGEVTKRLLPGGAFHPRGRHGLPGVWQKDHPAEGLCAFAGTGALVWQRRQSSVHRSPVDRRKMQRSPLGRQHEEERARVRGCCVSGRCRGPFCRAACEVRVRRSVPGFAGSGCDGLAFSLDIGRFAQR